MHQRRMICKGSNGTVNPPGITITCISAALGPLEETRAREVAGATRRGGAGMTTEGRATDTEVNCRRHAAERGRATETAS